MLNERSPKNVLKLSSPQNVNDFRSHTVKLKNNDVTIGMIKKIRKIVNAGTRNHVLYIFFFIHSLLSSPDGKQPSVLTADGCFIIYSQSKPSCVACFLQSSSYARAASSAIVWPVASSEQIYSQLVPLTAV